MSEKTKWQDFLETMSDDELSEYAEKAGTTANYINVHLNASPPRKIPRKDLMRGLANASNGGVTFEDVLAHFYSTAGDAGTSQQQVG